MIVFVSGGCKNGKSTFAQNLVKELSGGENMVYLATMIPHDREDLDRIDRHRDERDGWGFRTVECGMNIADCIGDIGRDDSVLMDSVTALLSNEMFLPDWEFNDKAHLKVAEQLIKLSKWVKNIVLVSDFIYSDAGLYDDYTECYRSGLAFCDRELVKISDLVVELCSGNLVIHKGELPQ